MNMDFMNNLYVSFVIGTFISMILKHYYTNNDYVISTLTDYENSIIPTQEMYNVYIIKEVLKGTSINMIYGNIMYIYIYLLNRIIDMNTIVEYHLLYIVMYLSDVISMNFFEMKTWFVFLGSMYGGNILFKCYERLID